MLHTDTLEKIIDHCRDQAGEGGSLPYVYDHTINVCRALYAFAGNEGAGEDDVAGTKWIVMHILEHAEDKERRDTDDQMSEQNAESEERKLADIDALLAWLRTL